MAITNFIPEIWSAQLLSALRDQLTYAQTGMINRNYQGDISRAGDTVHITSVGDVTVKDYSKNAGLFDGSSTNPSIDYEILSDSVKTLTITEQDYWAFGVDDIDERQAMNSSFISEATQSAAYGLAARTDSFVSGLMAAGVDADNHLGSVSVSNGSEAYQLLVDLRTTLVKTNTPASGRWVVVPPEMYAKLLLDDRFIRADASGTTAGLRNGFVGRAAGFDVIESNVVPNDESATAPAVGEFTVLAGHSMATTYADQISKTEAIPLESGFADGVRGLHVYGGLVVRPTLLSSALVTVS